MRMLGGRVTEGDLVAMGKEQAVLVLCESRV